MGDSLVPSAIAASGAVDQLRSKTHLYILPADKPEHQRLDLQQELLTRIRNGLFLCKEGVHRALASKAGDPRPVVLDVGCGSGFWTVEMAKQFPEVDVVGIDLFIPDVLAPIPSNCRFEQYDENKEPWTVVEEDEGASSFSYHVLWMTEFWEAMKSKGPGILAYPNISRWFQDMGREKWEEIGFWDIYVPIGPWKENITNDEKETSDLMRQDMLKIHQASRNSLRASGVSEETTRRWSDGARDELLKLQKRIYCRWLFHWAVKVDEASPS